VPLAPITLQILLALAEGESHGYAISKDVALCMRDALGKLVRLDEKAYVVTAVMPASYVDPLAVEPTSFWIFANPAGLFAGAIRGLLFETSPVDASTLFAAAGLIVVCSAFWRSYRPCVRCESSACYACETLSARPSVTIRVAPFWCVRYPRAPPPQP
jgi:hypothetical protein